MSNRGRPTDYNQETADLICAEITEGKSVRSICDSDDMPSARTVFYWLAQHEEFLQQYTRARSHRADARFERIDQVLDDLRAGVVDAQQARVEIDAIKWQCGKEHGKYNDKQTLEHTGKDGAPLTIRWADD